MVPAALLFALIILPARGLRAGGGGRRLRHISRLKTTTGGDDGDGDGDPWALVNKAGEEFIAGTENVIKGVTGNENYVFGDITKGTVETVVKTVARDESYHFGDLTKSAIENLSGKEASNYEFGDITRKALTDAEHQLEDWRDDFFHDLPNVLQRKILKDMSPKQRADLVDAVGGYGAMAVLCWSLVSTLAAGSQLAIATAWTPKGPGRVARALARVGSLKMFQSILLPAKALMFAVAVPRYHAASVRVERKLPAWPYRRALAAFLAYVVGLASITLATAGVLVVV